MELTELLTGLLCFFTFMLAFFVVRNKWDKRDIKHRINTASQFARRQGPGDSQFQLKTGANEVGVSELFDMSAAFGASEYKTLFVQAGWSTKNVHQRASLIKLALACGFAFAAVILIMTWGRLSALSTMLKLTLILSSGALGYLLFEQFMRIIIRNRYQRISHDLHNAVELLVVCSKAGMGIEKGLERVAEEVSQYNPDLGRELYTTAIELEIMPNRKVAYENMRTRMDIPLIHGMTTTLIQAEEQGTSISDSLRVMSEEFRTQLLLMFERKAAKLPATLSVPVVLFTLPTLMAVILGPAIIKLMRDSIL